MATPLNMPMHRKAATTVRLAYRTSTGMAQRDEAVLAAHFGWDVADRDEWPACCDTGIKSLAAITGCQICIL